MKAELARGFFLALLVSACLAKAGGSERTNELFVRESFQQLSDSLLQSLESADSLGLEFKCGECPLDFFVNILIGCLKQKVDNLYIDNGEQLFDKLRINLYNYAFYYDKSGGSLFSNGRLNRHFQAGITAVLLDGRDKVVWQHAIDNKYSEEIKWEDARLWEKRPGGVFHASLPAANRNRLWEPLLISGLLGGLVYLFFASR